MAPAAKAAADFESYVSDPAKPIPFIPRPVHIEGEAGEARWQSWLVSDQRDVASRTDVLSFSTPPLQTPVKISGEPIANLIAATSGTDGDFVVKLIDVYPDEYPAPASARRLSTHDCGRYLPGTLPRVFQQTEANSRGSEAGHTASPSPTSNHVFLAGHRIMVQVQSSWFPLYDRNPQTYVDNIFFAKPTDFKKATVKIYDGGDNASFLDLPVVKALK